LVQSTSIPLATGERIYSRWDPWLAGGLWFVVKESAVRVVGHGLGLALAVALLVAHAVVAVGGDAAGEVSGDHRYGLGFRSHQASLLSA
jgi:hypothetical protein